MDRSEIEALLEGLPGSESRLLAAARQLEKDKLDGIARDLLARAVEGGAGPLCRLELSLRLIDGGRGVAALKTLEPIELTSPFWTWACLLRALACSDLGRTEKSREHFNQACKVGLSEQDKRSWESHLFEGGSRPGLSFRAPGEEFLDGEEFVADEPTHLIMNWDGGSDGPTEPSRSRRSENHSTPDEKTTVRPRPSISSDALSAASTADEATVLQSFPSSVVDDAANAATGVHRRRRELTDPTLPPETDLAAEMPRFATPTNERIRLSEQRHRPPQESSGSQPILRGPMALMLDDQESSFADLDSDAEIELDLPDEVRQKRARAAAHRPPGTAQQGKARTPRPDLQEPALTSNLHSVRRFTVLVRDRASSHIAEVLQSPLRALLLAILTASLVLFGGMAAIYTGLTRAHLERQLQTIERAIDADLYSSHLAASRDLRELADYQLVPIAGLDRGLRRLSHVIPGLGVESQFQTIDELDLFVTARLSYRFDTPGSFPFDVDDERFSESPLGLAAKTYALLSFHRFDEALALAKSRLADGGGHRFVLLAYGDTILASDSRSEMRLVAETFPETTPAEAFITAKIRRRLEPESALDFLRHHTTGGSANHVGMHLELARALVEAGQTEEARTLAAPFRDSGHAHASRRERAMAHLVRAESFAHDEDRQGQQRELELAADIAPLHPDIVAPLIDFFMTHGELLEARARLSRIPASPGRHAYYDVALARVHLAVGDLERALQRLEEHKHTSLEAALLRAQAEVLSENEPSTQLLAFIDAKSRDDSNLFQSWQLARAGNSEQSASKIESLQEADLLPDSLLLKAETHRLLASLADSRPKRVEHLQQAQTLLSDAVLDTPESRRIGCLTALDTRDIDESEEKCRPVSELDFSSRPSLHAAVRWLISRGEHEEAKELIDRHLRQTGPDISVTFLSARLSLLNDDLDGLRPVLDGLPASAQRTREHLLLEGHYALRHGRFQRARDLFEEAVESATTYSAEAIVGAVEAAIFAGIDGEDEALEEAIRGVLRDGEFGPRAWAVFALLRLRQGRIADARENIAFAAQARDGFGSKAEERFVLTARIAIEQAHRGVGHAQVKRLIDEAEELGAQDWHFHLLAARWHAAQRRVDDEALRDHLRQALTEAPEVCLVWQAVDDIDNRRLRSQVTARITRPSTCR